MACAVTARALQRGPACATSPRLLRRALTSRTPVAACALTVSGARLHTLAPPPSVDSVSRPYTAHRRLVHNTASSGGGAAADLPFCVSRTGPGNLPVYCTRANTRVATEVRLVSGDLSALADALAEVTGARAKVRPTGSAVEVAGDQVDTVRAWLAQQGF
jgi:hypothetical protein